MFDKMREVHTLNTKGMDYIFTDLHGNFDLFQKALDILQFDPTKDRVIIAGDLCDRGPESLRCLKLILEDWVIAIPGNHEQMLVEYTKNPNSMYGRAFMYNGGHWIYDYPPFMWEEAGINEVVAKIETLPRMLTVEGRNKVHVVHAELNVGLIDHQITDADIEDPDILRKMLTLSSLDGDFSFWGRAVFGEFYGHPMPSYDMLNQKGIDRLAKFSHPNLSLIISGHTIMDKPLCFGNLLNIDTGAYKGSLSGYCIQTNTVFTLNENASDFVYEVNKINLND